MKIYNINFNLSSPRLSSSETCSFFSPFSSFSPQSKLKKFNVQGFKGLIEIKHNTTLVTFDMVTFSDKTSFIEVIKNNLDLSKEYSCLIKVGLHPDLYIMSDQEFVLPFTSDNCDNLISHLYDTIITRVSNSLKNYHLTDFDLTSVQLVLRDFKPKSLSDIPLTKEFKSYPSPFKQQAALFPLENESFSLGIKSKGDILEDKVNMTIPSEYITNKPNWVKYTSILLVILYFLFTAVSFYIAYLLEMDNLNEYNYPDKGLDIEETEIPSYDIIESDLGDKLSLAHRAVYSTDSLPADDDNELTTLVVDTDNDNDNDNDNDYDSNSVIVESFQPKSTTDIFDNDPYIGEDLINLFKELPIQAKINDTIINPEITTDNSLSNYKDKSVQTDPELLALDPNISSLQSRISLTTPEVLERG